VGEIGDDVVETGAAQAFFVPPDDHDRRAPLGEQSRGGQADAAGATGDHGGLPG